ncbi:MAG: hypothetical protein ACI9S8_002150 [Chlamydiales bacterium]|jgi:hypothetical protein
MNNIQLSHQTNHNQKRENVMKAGRCGGHHSRSMNVNNSGRAGKKSGRYATRQDLKSQKKTAQYSNKIRSQSRRQNNATAKFNGKMNHQVSATNNQSQALPPEVTLALLMMTIAALSRK